MCIPGRIGENKEKRKVILLMTSMEELALSFSLLFFLCLRVCACMWSFALCPDMHGIASACIIIIFILKVVLRVCFGSLL